MRTLFLATAAIFALSGPAMAAHWPQCHHDQKLCHNRCISKHAHCSMQHDSHESHNNHGYH